MTWDDGLYREHNRGIALGCPLSPLLGALHLAEVDGDMDRHCAFYVRFMDDLLVLAPSRPKLRQAVKRLHGHFARLKLAMHPDKTFVGRWRKGFEFLGLHFGPEDPKALGLDCAELTGVVAEKMALFSSRHQSQPDQTLTALHFNIRTSASMCVNLGPARAAWAHFLEKWRWLYEQGAGSQSLDDYILRWQRWLHSGLTSAWGRIPVGLPRS